MKVHYWGSSIKKLAIKEQSLQCKTLLFNACKNVHVSILSRKSDGWKAFIIVQNTIQSIERHDSKAVAVDLLILGKQCVKSFLILILSTDYDKRQANKD